jgi:hypothetical protein
VNSSGSETIIPFDGRGRKGRGYGDDVVCFLLHLDYELGIIELEILTTTIAVIITYSYVLFLFLYIFLCFFLALS